MFLGEYRHTIDQKNRVALPAKFRSALSEGVVITKGIDECLFVYPKSRWEEWARQLSKLPVSQSKTRAFLRMMLGGAMEAQLDAQGRIVIPDYLKEHCRLTRNVVIVGLYDRFEIWDIDLWHNDKTRTEKDGNHIAETLASMGI